MTKIITPRPQIIALRGEGKSDSNEDKITNELLEHQRQRRNHKRFLFWSTLVSLFLVYFLFAYVIIFTDKPKELLQISPFALIPVSLLGITPIIILILLFKSVFRPASSKLFDKQDMEILEVFKEVAAIIKDTR